MQGGFILSKTEIQQQIFDFQDLMLNDEGKPSSSWGQRYIKWDLDKRISTVLDADRTSELFLDFNRGNITEKEFDEGLENCIQEEGMTKAEIEYHFPPAPNSFLTFCRKGLIRAIIWEEKVQVGKDRPKGSIRRFWYSNLMYTLLKVMDDRDIGNINTTFQQCLTDLVEHKEFRYSDLNLVSQKNDLCVTYFEDSPYPSVILACEKEDYHQHLKRLAKVFHITYISLGGQGSYQVYEALYDSFIEKGVDLSQTFHIFDISDFDPQGYEIEDTIGKHLNTVGVKNVEIHRVYMTEDQLTPGLVDRRAVPYDWKKKTVKGNKSALTFYNKFGERTGGIYKKEDDWERFSKNRDRKYDVPIFEKTALGYDLYRFEIDNFNPKILLELFIDALENFIDGAEYYYKKAKDYAQDIFEQRVSDTVKKIIVSKVKNRYCDVYIDTEKLERNLSRKSEEMTSDIIELKEVIEEEYQEKDETIQLSISYLDSEIQALEDQRDALYRDQEDLLYRHEEIQKVLQGIRERKSKQVSDLEHRIVEKIIDVLNNYKSQAKEEMSETVREQLEYLVDFPIKDWMDFTQQKKEVFRSAREGQDDFEVSLDWDTESDLRYKVGEEVNQKKKDVIQDDSIGLPSPPEEVEKIQEVIEDIESKLEDVKASQLDDTDRNRIKVLKDLFFDKLYEYDEIWIATDLYNFLDDCIDFLGGSNE